jgi:hypothetical protein
MKKLVSISITSLALAIALGFGFIPSMDRSASCADCEADNLPQIKKAFEAFDENCKKELADSTAQRKSCFASNVYNKLLPILKALSKDNRFGPGNRILLPGEAQNGDLLAGANRAFQSLAPTDKDSMTIELNKTDGGNGALVQICSIDDSGTVKRIGTIKFDENSETGKKSTTVTGVQGKIVRVNIASFGGALKKFQYTLKTSQ